MNGGLSLIKSNIEKEIKSDLDRIGVHYRIHSRIKEKDSLLKKISDKGEGYYAPEGQKVQDVFGFRITTYFDDDVKLLWNLFETKYSGVGVYDKVDPESFKPLRKNLICKFSTNEKDIFDDIKLEDRTYLLVDNTFEIQFRTTFSEGWHEVDHTLRYKCKSDWEELIEESRMLNGFYALLETSDKALLALFEDLSYHHYKKKNWEAMLRTKFRINFNKSSLDEEICNILNNNIDLAKGIFRVDRNDIISKVAYSRLHVPISFDNLVFLINFTKLKSEAISELLPTFIKSEFELTLS